MRSKVSVGCVVGRGIFLVVGLSGVEYSFLQQYKVGKVGSGGFISPFLFHVHLIINIEHRTEYIIYAQ